MILGLTGVQQKQHQPPLPQQQQQRRSPLRGRRCLYCQQIGCRGIQSCWWPRTRSGRGATALSSRVEPVPSLWNSSNNNNNNNNNSDIGSGNAVEDNLRSQISVLEREVQLLRNGLNNLVGSKGEPHVSTEHLPYFNKNNMSRIREVSTPSHVVIPPCTKGTTQMPYQQEEKTTNVMMPPVTEETPLSPVLPEKTEPQRVEELEKLVLELVAQNTKLCRNLAELNSVLEQRDELLRSLFSERNRVVPPASVPATVQTTTSSSFESSHEQEMTLMTHLLQKQQEVAQLQEEMRSVKVMLENSKEDLQSRVNEVEFLRSQLVQMRSLQKSNVDGVYMTSTPVSSFNTGQIQVPSQPVIESTMLNSTVETSNKETFVTPSVNNKITGVDTSVVNTEIRELREKLAIAERKILAWETWYQQEQQEQRQKQSSLQRSEEIIHRNSQAPQPATVREKPHVSLLIPSKDEQPKNPDHQQFLLRALPSSQPIHHLCKPPGDILQPSGCNADILAVDTYALISREAALREAAKQERCELMAALMKKDEEEGIEQSY
ncbi:hypothetical protein LSM04_006644 [Trypanosoma melophagium]|uniref:uncharacterized protein n=1 Tax=Trypanosoma melophagium TaxID=715481 RepID=UPI00351A0EC9|nr:hypothetical protein LSM04_006644 [Trypanosoma melophagium]